MKYNPYKFIADFLMKYSYGFELHAVFIFSFLIGFFLIFVPIIISKITGIGITHYGAIIAILLLPTYTYIK